MSYHVPINEIELFFVQTFRVALSLPTYDERVSAIENVRHEVIAARLVEINKNPGAGWVKDKANRELVEWVAATEGERVDGMYELSRASHAYEQKNERRLNIAEEIGKVIVSSIGMGKFEGVQTPNGILYQVGEQCRKSKISGGRDKDTLRKIWRDYQGVVHLGMALDFIEDTSTSMENVFHVADRFRRTLSTSCPKRTQKPYVSSKSQFSFSYESGIYGPRFQDRGLPFYLSK